MYSLMRGVVYDPNDPNDQGRVRLTVPGVNGDAPLFWAEPMVPPASTYQPSVGDVMWVWFENDDINKPVYTSTAEITAQMLQAVLIMASRIVVGDPDGERWEINKSQVIATNKNDVIVLDLSPDTDKFIQVIDSDDNTVAALNSTGDLVANNVDFTGVLRGQSASVYLDGTPLSASLSTAARGMVVFGQLEGGQDPSQIPSSYAEITTETPIMELDWVSPQDAAERWYEVSFDALLDPANLDEPVGWKVIVYYTTDGTAPVIGDPILKTWDGVTSNGQPVYVSGVNRWQPSQGNQLYRFLMTLQCTGGSLGDGGYIGIPDTDGYYINMWLNDVGNQNAVNTGMLPGQERTVLQSQTNTYDAQWFGDYQDIDSESGDDTLITGSGLGMVQGENPADPGAYLNQGVAIGFDTAQIQSDLAGSTVTGVALYLYATDWYESTGGDAIVGYHSYSGGSAPGNWSDLDAIPDVTVQDDIQKPGSTNIDITGSDPGNWATGGYTGVVLGAPGITGDQYYGTFSSPSGPNSPRLMITFTR